MATQPRITVATSTTPIATDIPIVTNATVSNAVISVADSIGWSTSAVYEPKRTLDDICQLNLGDKDFVLSRDKMKNNTKPLKDDESTQYVAYRVYNLLSKIPGDRVLRFMGEIFQIDVEDDATLRMLYDELMKIEVMR